MTPCRRKRSVAAVLIVLLLCGAVLAHFTIVDRFSPALGALFALAPAAALALWLARRSRNRWTRGWRGAGIAAACAVAAAALWAEWGTLERNFTDVLFLEHAGGNLALAALFGRTLAAGREPLCTRFARMLHEELPPEVVAYTRAITVAWTAFFASLFALSAALYLSGHLAAWSMLATIASPILVVLMFLAEYAVRLRALPRWERIGILGGIRAFFRHFAAARFEALR